MKLLAGPRRDFFETRKTLSSNRTQQGCAPESWSMKVSPIVREPHLFAYVTFLERGHHQPSLPYDVGKLEHKA